MSEAKIFAGINLNVSQVKDSPREFVGDPMNRFCFSVLFHQYLPLALLLAFLPVMESD